MSALLRHAGATVLIPLVVAFMFATPVAPQESPVGVWDVIEWFSESPEGERTYSKGSDPNGLFVYTPEGNLILHATTNPLLAPQPTPTSTEDLALRATSTTAYYGTYTVDLEKSEVTHHIQGNLSLNSAGISAVRPFRIEDGDLILEWISTNGVRVYRRLRRLEAF